MSPCVVVSLGGHFPTPPRLDGEAQSFRPSPCIFYVRSLSGSGQCWSSGSWAERWVTFAGCGLPSSSTALWADRPGNATASAWVMRLIQTEGGRYYPACICVCVCPTLSPCFLPLRILQWALICVCVCTPFILLPKRNKTTVQTNRGKWADNQKTLCESVWVHIVCRATRWTSRGKLPAITERKKTLFHC